MLSLEKRKADRELRRQNQNGPVVGETHYAESSDEFTGLTVKELRKAAYDAGLEVPKEMTDVTDLQSYLRNAKIAAAAANPTAGAPGWNAGN